MPTKQITFKELWDNYPDEDDVIHRNPDTGKDLLGNYCAVKVSDALLDSGVSMKSFRGARCWNCPQKITHAIRATELANWLRKRPFPGCPKPLELTGKNFKEALDDKKGIIYFEDYWQRKGEEGTDRRTGDHIDLWDDGVLAGSGHFESFFRVTLGLSWDGWFSDHELSKVVLFWEMKK